MNTNYRFLVLPAHSTSGILVERSEMSTGDFAIREFVAPRVTSERPDWYDPNGASEFVEVTLTEQEGSMPLTFRFSLRELASLQLAGKPQEERVRIIKNFALRKILSEQLEAKEPKKESLGMVEQPAPVSVVSENVNGNGAHHTPFVSDSVPRVEVVVKPAGTPIKISTFYHDVICQEDCIVLIYNLSHVGYQRLSFDPGTVANITIPCLGIANKEVEATTYNFSHNGFEYTILRNISSDEVSR